MIIYSIFVCQYYIVNIRLSRYLNRHWLFSLAFGCPDRGVSGKEPIHNSQSSISTNETVSSSRISNGLMGIVISTFVRLTRTTLRIRIGIRTDLRVSWQTALTSRSTVNIGQIIWVNTPEGAVHLEAGAFRFGKQRLNRWIGRVVRLNRTDQDLVTTVRSIAKALL